MDKQNQDLTICCLQQIHFSFKDSQAESEEMEKRRYSMWMVSKRDQGSYSRQNRHEVKKTVTKDKESHL